MKVMEGASFETDSGRWRKLEVEVDDADFDRLWAEWGAPRGGVALASVRYQVLANLAQGMLVTRQYQVGGMSREEAMQEAKRIHDERERLKSALVA
jgi:hypothetical protein